MPAGSSKHRQCYPYYFRQGKQVLHQRWRSILPQRCAFPNRMALLYPLTAQKKTGIAYQLVPDDPLIDTEQCKRDAKLMKELSANSIRVYHVDPDADHKGCMSAFADVGIYLWVDLDTFNTQIEEVRCPVGTIARISAHSILVDQPPLERNPSQGLSSCYGRIPAV